MAEFDMESLKMDKFDMETPNKKRPFIEVSVSPEGKSGFDASTLRDVLGDLLDHKLEEHLKSMKNDLAQFRRKTDLKQGETSQANLGTCPPSWGISVRSKEGCCGKVH